MVAYAEEIPQPVERGGISELASRIWLFLLAGLLLPSLLGWAIRGTAYGLNCAPENSGCLAPPFNLFAGALLKGTLDLAWTVGANFSVTSALTMLAGLAAIIAARPLSAALTVLLAPLAALLLPVALVGLTRYNGCPVNANAAGDCVVWGQTMGMTFHTAATAPELIYTYTPLAVAGAVVAGMLGWIVQWGYRQMERHHHRR